MLHSPVVFLYCNVRYFYHFIINPYVISDKTSLPSFHFYKKKDFIILDDTSNQGSFIQKQSSLSICTDIDNPYTGTYSSFSSKIMNSVAKSKVLNAFKFIYRSVHLEWSPNWKLSKKIRDRYKNLNQDCKVQVTYVWIDGTGQNMRSRMKTFTYAPNCYKECPNWSFDGSSCYLADVRASDVTMCPIAIYKDPIAQGNNKIVLCDTYTSEGKPTKTNFRYQCSEIFNKVCDKEPMFDFGQQFLMMDMNNRPFGWPIMLGEPSPLDSFYCSVGAEKAFGREIVECFYRCCLYAGIEIAGINAAATCSQWDIHIGPNTGIKAGDDVWMARYLIQRLAEDFGVAISIHPKLFPNWNGAGLHANFSTKEMREDGGYKHIEEAIKKLEKSHGEHMKVYDASNGKDNKLRLKGQYKASHFDKFTSGVGDRTASVRISNSVAHAKKGYFEDRRPAANADPYRVIQALISTLCLK